MNILMIDDKANFLKQLRQPLAQCGHTMTEAHDGNQGWKVFVEGSNTFDVIVMDIRMPVLTGVEVLKRLREKKYDIPVIIITGYEDLQTAIEGLRLGAFDLLLKPFQAKELVAILDKLEAIQAYEKKQLEELPFFTEDIRVSIHSHTALITSVGAFFQNRLKLFCKLNKIEVRNVGLCLHEALVNAIIHGNLEIPSELKNESPEEFEALLRERESMPEYANRQVSIRCNVTAERLHFEVEDQGKGFDPRTLQTSDPVVMLPTGRGLLIIESFMDEVFWNETGNRITMIKQLESA